MAANADEHRRFDAKDTKFDRIMNEILSDADRVIRNAMTELDLDSITTTDGDSHDEIVDYLQDKLRQSYPSNRKLRKLVTSLVVDSEMTAAVDHELARTARDDDVTTVTSLTESLQYDELKTNMRETIDRTTDQLARDCHWLTLTDTDRVGQFADSQWSLSSVSTSPLNYDTSSLASSYGAAYWEMLSGDRLDELADHLDVRHPWSLRRDALRTLSSLPMAEVVNFDEWPKLRARLRCLLLGCDTEAFHYGIRFHVKMLRSTSSHCVVESYLNLVEALYAFFESGYRCACDKLTAIPSSRFDSIPCNVLEKQVLLLSKLVNTFQKVIPQYWTRYSESQIRKIVEHTIRYLLDVPFDDNVRLRYFASSSNEGFDRILTPLHVLSVIDPRADWFDAWTCGDHGKRIVIRELERHNDVLPRLASGCLTAFEFLKKNRRDLDQSRQVSDSSAYGCLLHVIRILGNVLRNVEGRSLFDSQLGARNSLRFSDFLCSTLKAAFVTSRSTHICNEFCLGRVVVEVFESLIAFETSCADCFENGNILSVALEDVRSFVASPCDQLFSISDIHVLNHIIRFLSCLTDSCIGLQLILKFESQQQSATELVTIFAERLLLVHEDFVPSLRKTVEAIRTKSVEICCRLLADHEGIVTLKGTGVLYKIAEEWESRLRESDQTPVMGQTASERQQIAETSNEWLTELSVVGRTPIGVVSLYKTDLLQDILIYTENKFANNKMITSMDNTTMLFLSQTASLCCECPKLTTHLTPIANQIAMTIWSASELRSIESDTDIIPLAEESLTLVTNRFLADLVCILPSSEAIKRLFAKTSKQEGTDCSQSYLVKLVMSGIQNWYQRSELTCSIGLRLLSILGSDLNTWLYLESNFNFQEMLLEAQVTEDHEDPIIDQNTLLRNYLLVKITEIGGEGEKRLPPRSDHFDLEYLREWPVVTSVPIPQEYLLTLSALSSPPSEIKFFLKESHSDSLDTEWLVYCREVFRNCLTDEKVKLRGKWFGDLLYLATEALFRTATIIPFSSEECSEVSFDNNLGCQLVISYGLRLGLLEDGVKSVYDFLQTLSLRDTKTSKDFDWFAATVFLLTNGDVERTTTFVSHLQRLPQGQHLSRLTSSNLGNQSDNRWAVFCHNIEVVLRGDLPLVATAFVRSGMSVGQICQPWIAQCFWNVLDWEEICTYVGFCVLMGSDYQVFYVVALFRHLQKEILRHVALNDFPLFIRETRIEGFRTRDNLPFIDHLESKYRGILLQRTT